MGRVGFVTILIATAVGSTVAASSALGERQLVAALLANMTVAEKARQVGTDAHQPWFCALWRFSLHSSGAAITRGRDRRATGETPLDTRLPGGFD